MALNARLGNDNAAAVGYEEVAMYSFPVITWISFMNLMFISREFSAQQ
jgi:hypothetical protein